MRSMAQPYDRLAIGKFTDGGAGERAGRAGRAHAGIGSVGTEFTRFMAQPYNCLALARASSPTCTAAGLPPCGRALVHLAVHALLGRQASVPKGPHAPPAWGSLTEALHGSCGCL